MKKYILYVIKLIIVAIGLLPIAFSLICFGVTMVNYAFTGNESYFIFDTFPRSVIFFIFSLCLFGALLLNAEKIEKL